MKQFGFLNAINNFLNKKKILLCGGSVLTGQPPVLRVSSWIKCSLVKSCAISEHIPLATVHFLHKIKMYLKGEVDHKPSSFKIACGDGREFGFAFL